MNRHLYTALLLIGLLLLSACGGGGGGSDAPPQTQAITGGAIKGPLVNATVSVYAIDSSQPGFKGALIDSGSTDGNAAITGLDLPLPLTPPYIMEFTSTPGTTWDLTTGLPPIISTLSTVLTQTHIDSGKPVYATPLTTLAVNITTDIYANSTISHSVFEASVRYYGANFVVNTMGFGLSPGFDIFSTPPVVDNNVDTPAELADVLAYRTAIEALAALTFQMQEHSSSTGSAEDIFKELAKDYYDYLIDGLIIGGEPTVTYNAATLAVFTQNPANWPIPNSSPSQTVADVNEILIAETPLISEADTTGLGDGEGVTVILRYASTSLNAKTYYKVGDYGPALGHVISVSADGLRGVEALDKIKSEANDGQGGVYVRTVDAEVEAGLSTFGEASAFADAMDANGYRDWRLPTLPEGISLYSLYSDYDNFNYAFTFQAGRYWTSTIMISRSYNRRADGGTCADIYPTIGLDCVDRASDWVRERVITQDDGVYNDCRSYGYNTGLYLLSTNNYHDCTEFTVRDKALFNNTNRLPASGPWVRLVADVTPYAEESIVDSDYIGYRRFICNSPYDMIARCEYVTGEPGNVKITDILRTVASQYFDFNRGSLLVRWATPPGNRYGVRLVRSF